MTSGTEQQRRDRNAKAAELHLAGLSYAKVAEAIGLSSKSAAFDAVQAGLADRDDPAPADTSQAPDGIEDTVATEVARLDAMLAGLWPSARRGDVKAVDRVLKISERRMALLALLARANPAAPEPDEGDAGEGVPGVADIAAARARRLAETAGSPPS